MKKLIFLLFFFATTLIFAQQKFALVIGNSNYTGISHLNNPINDANDMALTLQNLGFTVDKIIDGDLEKMETAVINLKRKLGASRNTYGFFFYAGHGVQANGQNYLIPLPATNIQNETHLRDRAVSLQFVLDSLSEAGNELNMVVLDACRDNPFGWSRSGARGLSVVSQTPSGSIVMYAAASGQKADDGNGRNGLFTGYLLKNLKTTGLSVYEVFDKTMGDVKNVTGGKQDPELSLRFSGANSVYLGQRPNTPQNENVYIVGTDSDDAVYWLNGQKNVLPKTGGNSASANAIAVSGSNVYIAGYERSNGGRYAVYWLNGRKNVLPKTKKYAEATAIAISGSNIYITGIEYDVGEYADAVYWLNGKKNILPKTGRSAIPTAIAVLGSDVYIAGYEYIEASSDAVYWLNGKKNILPKTGNSARAQAIAVSGSNVYIAGYVNNDNATSDAVYWLNGRINILQTKTTMNNMCASTIQISGSNVYITGYGIDEAKNINTIDAVYWINNQITVLPKASKKNAIPNAITVTDTNVYITGYEYDSGDTDDSGFVAVYWLNGQRNVLPQTGRFVKANAITVTH